MKQAPNDRDEETRARSIFEQCWLGPLCLAFWVLVILAVFHGCSKGAECTIGWNWQGDAKSYRVYCGIDLLATVNSPATQATVTLPDAPCTVAVVAVNPNGQSLPTTMRVSYLVSQESADMRAWSTMRGSHTEFIEGRRFYRTRIETP